MMTPAELRQYEFKSAGRNAYKSDEVDSFFAEVAISYEKMYRENAEMTKRMSLIADRLEQYKKEENDIKQAILSAQKAADIIVKQAEESVEDTKVEADAILAAAKGEAEIIKSDAEKQAIADSDLLLSIARDKAEEIINKAKEEAHGILIEANNSASNTVGAATRTITSESIHYEMLKKEVSEFRSSLLAQYKAHIELISKLPELAAEEASKIEPEEVSIEDTSDNAPVTEEAEISFVDETEYAAQENSEIEIVEASEVLEITPEEDGEFSEVSEDGEQVVKTTLPYDFFAEDTSIEFIENDSAEDEEEFVEETTKEAVEEEDEIAEETIDESALDDVLKAFDENASCGDTENKTIEDIAISKGFSVNTTNIDNNYFSGSLFDSIEAIDGEDIEVDPEPVAGEEESESDDSSKGFFGFFRHRK